MSIKNIFIYGINLRKYIRKYIKPINIIMYKRICKNIRKIYQKRYTINNID